MATATPAKLRSGEWGARVRGSVERGDTVTITTRAGKSWEARVDRVLWSGNGVSLVATSSASSAPRRSSGGGEPCAECGERGGRYTRRDSSGLSGMVCGICNRCSDFELSFA